MIIFCSCFLRESSVRKCAYLGKKYRGVRVIASRVLQEICLLIGELAIRGTELTMNARLGTESNLLIEQYCY